MKQIQKQKLLTGMVRGFRIVLASVFIFSLGIAIPAQAADEPDLVILSYELRNEANNAVITAPNPNESFYIRMTIRNQGTAATGLFYPGVFIDDKPNYGPDTDPFGRLSDWSGYRITPAGSVDGEGCVYYDPTNSIDPLTTSVNAERGNYTRPQWNDALDPDTQVTVDVYIGYPDTEPEYNDPAYAPYRNGLPAGSYNIYLYADPNCSGGDSESNETNNSYGPINLNLGGINTGPADVSVTIGNDLKGTYPMTSGQSMVQTYSGVNGGPVVIKSNNGNAIIASYFQLRRPGATGGWTGITQTMALTDAQISDIYVFPRYDYADPTKYNAFQLANFDSIATNVTVKIGTTTYGPYPIGVGSNQNVTFDNVVGGPVVISSDNGAKIVASLYELKRPETSGLWTGQTQMMGLPWSQLSDTYVFPRYNYTLQDLLPSIYFANADSIPTSVTVTIGGIDRGTYDLTSGQSMVQTYSGVNGGPVVIQSNNGAKIIASYFQLRRPGTTGGWTGITQTMALTDAQISDIYVFPRYDYADPTKYNAFQLANFDSIATNVTVKIGTTTYGPYPIGVGSNQNVTFDNVVGGPVVISSDNGAKIVASLYELKRPETSGLWTGQTQMMGLPWSQLSDTYVFPRYNYTLQDLLPSIYFAVP